MLFLTLLPFFLFFASRHLDQFPPITPLFQDSLLDQLSRPRHGFFGARDT
jgi:hypothetical protein